MLRLSLGVPGFSSTLRKSLHWELVQTALIFVKYYGYNLRGMNSARLRPLEKFSRPPKAFIKKVLWDDFSQGLYTAELLEIFESKKLF